MKTTISVKVDEDVKKTAQEIARSTGMSLSTLVNTYLHQLANTRRIELYAPEPMTPQMERIIAEAEREIANGETIGPFSVEEFISYLEKNDRDKNKQ